MINTKRLRATIGFLGMLLPWIVLGLSLKYEYGFPDSISFTYYFAPCITPFMIILGSAGLLLFSYKGYEIWDDIICTLSGLLALGICLFPCTNYAMSVVGTFQLAPRISGLIHNICALGFFGLLAYNSLFFFTKSVGVMTPNKRARNRIYRICGVGMVLSFLGLIPVIYFNIYGGIWVVETIALTFFGISWLTKANCFSWLYAD